MKLISPNIAKLIEYLPNKLRTFLVKSYIDNLIRKKVNLVVKGKENLKDIKKPVIFVCNHLSNSDAVMLEMALKEQDVTYVAGIKLTQNPTTNLIMRLLKTTTLKPNAADKEGLTRIVNIIKNKNNVLIFPEGTRSRTRSMIGGKKGILLIARVTKASIVPIGIWGSEKFLPINDNGDMAGESFHDADIYINIGKQIDVPLKQQGEGKSSYEERALTYIMKSIAGLVPEEYRGVYK